MMVNVSHVNLFNIQFIENVFAKMFFIYLSGGGKVWQVVLALIHAVHSY